MNVGDTVECVDNLPERSNPICTPLVIGKRYKVLGVRNNGYEIKLIPGETETDKLGWWKCAYRFKLVEEAT